jgi:hypothetical protein
MEVLNMLGNLEKHCDYQKKLLLNLIFFLEIQRSRVVSMSKSISKLYLLDLDNLLPVIKPLYSNTGFPARNQLGIIRSLVLMLDSGKHSITNWAKEVASDKLLCIICGFEFGKAPSVGSYYDLLKRFWLSSHNLHVKKSKTPKHFKKKPTKKLKAGEKLPPKHGGVVKKLANFAMRGKLPDYRPEKILQDIFARCVVDTSAKLGILGNTEQLSTAGDGTCYKSGASPFGKKVCDCKSKGIYKCKCKRLYSDPDARWGWDSYHEEYFYGDTLYNITASDSPFDLPIYLRIVQAPRHDSITTVFALSEIRSLYPQFTIKNFIADGAMDNYATYKLLNYWDINPYIPLDSKTTFNVSKPGVLCFDDKGIPICLGGIPYHCCGYSYPKGIKYRCWFDYKGIDKPCSCTDNNYGRTIYLKPEDDLRLFTPVPRHSNVWRSKFKTRTSVERSHKRILVDYDIEAGKCRSSRQRFARAVFAAINVHLDAWIKHLNFNIIELIEHQAA